MSTSRARAIRESTLYSFSFLFMQVRDLREVRSA